MSRQDVRRRLNFLNLILSNQKVYVINRFVNESGALISDILEITDVLKLERYLQKSILKRFLTLMIIKHPFHFYWLFLKNMNFTMN